MTDYIIIALLALILFANSRYGIRAANKIELMMNKLKKRLL